MKKVITWFILLSNLNISVAKDSNYLGTYTKDSAVKIYVENQHDCSSLEGLFNPEDNSCVIIQKDGYEVNIFKNKENITLVHIETIRGNGVMRSYDGKVIKQKGSELHTEEVDLNEDNTINSITPNGCTVTIKIKKKGMLDTIPSVTTCIDLELTVLNAVKKN
ncbi:MAG: hypothetical protein HUU56_04300 [Bdellovibrionaceae bacterium]|nr:hypothetical protein [Pseudobdellovibrionaceae bacterium]